MLVFLQEATIGGKARLKKGFCIIDFGVKYKGYHSDITRTIYLGNPSKKEITLYNLLLKIQKELIKKIKIGERCSQLYKDTLTLLDKYSDNFTHGLGHGLGLNIHELPNLTEKSEDIFMNNMVFTIEPGIYFQNKFGIRIEDDILIKNGKIQILTKIPKKLIVKRHKT
jgi:Xaa-Pro aminopeptidase